MNLLIRFGAYVVIPVTALTLAAACAGCEDIFGPPQTQPAQTQPTETRYNDAYLSALSTADAFCDAWRQCDEASGRALLSLRMKRKYPDRDLRNAIVGHANPRHAGYEIFDGKRMRDGRYAFKVRLFYRYSGSHRDKVESPLVRIVVVREETGDWKVDEFPIPRAQGGVRSSP